MNIRPSYRPSKGMIITTSYNIYKGLGYYMVSDIASKEIIIEKHFNDILTSSNLIGLFAICDFYRHCLQERFTCERIYCSNKVAVDWAKSKKCNTSCKSLKAISYMEQSITFLKSNDFSERINLWEKRWGTWVPSYPADDVDVDYNNND